jgi:hypothetical protein
LRFKDKLRSIIIKIIIGFIMGLVLGLSTNMGVSVSIFIGIMFAGVPYAWSVIPVIAFGLITILIKLGVAIFLGWIVTPIALAYNFYRSISNFY